jgi:hypothetical protein
VLQRDRGRLWVGGSSQAHALTWTTRSGGKSPGGDPDALVPPIPSDDPKRNVSASGRLPHGEYPNDRQSRHCSIPRRLTRPSWHAGPENTVTYICRLSAAIPTSRQTTSESRMGSISAWRGTCLNHATKSPLHSMSIIRDCIYETADLASGEPATCRVGTSGAARKVSQIREALSSQRHLLNRRVNLKRAGWMAGHG